MKTILVTGANGFVGRHVSQELTNNDMRVIGIGGPHHHKAHQSELSNYITADLTKEDDVRRVDFSSIDGVIHLAGLAAVGPSFDNPMLYIDANIRMEVNLFEAALKQGCTPKFLIVSSGSLYDGGADLPLTETSPVIPSSPYAVSKLGQEHAALYYTKRGFQCTIARPFNHIGPGQGEGFIVADISKQMIATERGEVTSVKVGNLDARRDYTDVRDIARAYRLLVQRGRSGEIYNVCSGSSHSGKDILNGLLKHSKAKPKIVTDPTKMRPSDTPNIYGNSSKLMADTGWKPEIALNDTLHDALNDWRNK